MSDNDFIKYEELIDEAMHIIVKRALEIAAEEGLPGDHHFFLSFLTHFPGVKMSQKLRNKYPDEMTIVLQYQFENLEVTDEGFGVSLSFDNVKEDLYIPFSALTAFADPTVKFGLQFRYIDGFEDEDDDMPTEIVAEQETPEKKTKAKPKGKAKTKKDASSSDDDSNVISLDKFRKK